MRRSTLLAVLLLLIVAPALRAHDLFLKLTNYFLAPGTSVTVRVFNGTFTTSENFVTRDRVQDVALVSGGTRQRLDTSVWSPSVDGKSGRVHLSLGAPGTYVLGASTLPRELTLAGKDFNAYLAEEGLGDIVAERKRNGEAADSARERYSKHVKAIFQVGARRTDDYAQVLNYPAEIVPQNNPYALAVGSVLTVRCLLGGTPAAGVVVLAGGRDAAGKRIPLQTVRAGDDGVARVKLTHVGAWYVKFIRMERRSSEGVNYESRWATLTFGVRQ